MVSSLLVRTFIKILRKLYLIGRRYSSMRHYQQLFSSTEALKQCSMRIFALFICLAIVGYSLKFMSSKKSEDDDVINPNHLLINGTTYVRQLHLCPSDFQRTLELKAFDRTLIVYETEWFSGKVNILAVLVENPQKPIAFLGNLATYFNDLYSIECLYKSKTSRGRIRHTNTHEYDRTVIIQCQTEQIDQNANSLIRVIFTELANKRQYSIPIHLCWSLDRRVTVGHCHKALFDDIPFHLIEQWLNYHLLIGIEQFYIYDRTLNYKARLQPWIDRGIVVYIPFPLAKQFALRERFNWIDQFVGKMHCLMRVRSAFDWLGTWDIDEYLNFFSEMPSNFVLPRCQSNGKCSTMISNYLAKNFFNYSNIIIYAVNYMGKRSLTISNENSSVPILIEQYQHRLDKWNDRVKYLVRPKRVEIINIHYALYITQNRTYESFVSSPSQLKATNPRGLIRFNHYPSAQYIRDDVFLQYHTGKLKYVHDPLLWQIHCRLHLESMRNTSFTITAIHNGTVWSNFC